MHPVYLLPITCCLAAPLPAAMAQSGWTPSPEVIRKTSAERPGFCFTEEGVSPFTLPPLHEGTASLTPAEWEARRKALLETFENQMFGKMAEAPDAVHFSVTEENPKALGGSATMQRVQIRSVKQGREYSFEAVLSLPNRKDGPAPVFLFLNNRSPSHTDPQRNAISEFWPVEHLIERGYGAAAINVRALSPDSPERYREGVLAFLEGENPPDRPDAPGSLAAWAWGARRVLDYLQTHPKVDHGKVAVVGHSRGGKAALWAGAQDDRFALVVSNESGCGGAALSRRRFGETVARINQRYPHWFCKNFHAYNDREDALPVDQHQLLALVAPRALYVASADEDLWSDPKGEFLSLVYASPAYEIYGNRGIYQREAPSLNTPVFGDRQGYHIRGGKHDLLLEDWMRFLDFADRLWGKPL